MTPFLQGFASELVKVAGPTDASFEDAFSDAKREAGRRGPPDSALRALRGSGQAVSRDYLASMLIGAAATPAIALIGKRLARVINNRDVMRAMHAASSGRAKRTILKELHAGPSFGRALPGVEPRVRPLMTHGGAAGAALGRALGGSAVQMIRDYFSGSKGTKQP